MASPQLDATIAQALELLDDLGRISSRKMFGGAGLYAEGVMFALIADEEIYLKATGDFANTLADRGSGAFIYDGKGKPIRMSYWRMPDAALDDPEEAVALARQALICAHEGKK